MDLAASGIESPLLRQAWQLNPGKRKLRPVSNPLPKGGTMRYEQTWHGIPRERWHIALTLAVLAPIMCALHLHIWDHGHCIECSASR